MASPYDENLLALAPEATKAQLQGGYNPDILVEKPSSTPTTPLVDPEAAADYHPTPVRNESEDILPFTKKKVPFYATKMGIIIIVAVVVIVIAAVVGGAVGGTRKKNTTAAVVPTSTKTAGGGSQSASMAGGGQSGGIAPPSSTEDAQPVGSATSTNSGPST